MSDGFDFLGFRIQWKRKGGTTKWHVYTFIADRPIRSLKAKWLLSFRSCGCWSNGGPVRVIVVGCGHENRAS
ncbi:hypothetical protein ACFWSP_40280, partial [Streptomyces sp. NPDC058618]|uniref:hypothetical protein n=1 Tax=unclassified Streptomyces TaxID=2593676 RepID=UPI003658531C